MSGNPDLISGLAYSESFVNDAVEAVASYAAGSLNSSAVAKTNLAVAYDAGANSYTVTVGAKSQIFLPIHRDNTLSGVQSTVYTRTEGAITDTLIRSNNRRGPGTPNEPEFEYVGGGIWQRQVAGSTPGGSIDAFSYGVVTPSTAMPTSGTASYAAILRGIAAFPDTVRTAEGAGKLTIDFAAGSISGRGTIAALAASGDPAEANRVWIAGGTITSGEPAFSGGIRLSQPGNELLTGSDSGSLAGRFYGPARQELGAAWYWRDNGPGTTFAGYLLGKNLALLPTNTSFDALHMHEGFAALSLSVNFSRDNQTNQLFPAGTDDIQPVTTGVSYSEARQALVLWSPFLFDFDALTPAVRDAVGSSSSFDLYHFTKPRSLSGGATGTDDFRVWLSRPGAGNPEISLSYTSFGHWEAVLPDYSRSPRYDEVRLGVFAYGRQTPDGSVPTSGTATYSGVIYGLSAVPKDIALSQAPYTISGSAALTYNFAAPSFSGSMHAFAENPAGGPKYDLGNYAFGSSAGRPIGFGEAVFNGKFDTDFPFLSNGFTGVFTGPGAEEMFARWTTGMVDPINGGNIAMTGVMVGKQ